MVADSLAQVSVGNSSEGGLFASVVGFFFAVQWMTTLALGKLAGVDPQAGSAVRLALTFLLLIVTAVAWAASRRTAKVNLAVRPLAWVFGYLALCAVSFAWTQAASPITSSLYLLATAADVCIVLLLLRRDADGRQANALMRGFMWGAVLVALIAWAMPAQYDLRLGDEDYFNSNTIAYLCAFGAFFAQWQMRGEKARWIPVLVLLVMTVLRSLSKTTMVAFLLSEAFLLIVDRSMSRAMKLWLMIGTGVLILMFWGLFVAYYDFYLSNGNQAETLTGRTGIWLWTWNAIGESPWIGHGFDSTWKVAPRFGTFEARHAENEFLQQFYALGAAGVLVTCCLYASLWRAVWRAKQDSRRAILLSMILFVLIRGLAEAEPFDLQLPLWMVVLLLAVVADPQRQERMAEVRSEDPGLEPNVIRL